MFGCLILFDISICLFVCCVYSWLFVTYCVCCWVLFGFVAFVCVAVYLTLVCYCLLNACLCMVSLTVC